jgi:hypothetical protein
MPEREILLESAAFLDSPQAAALEGLERSDAKAILERFLTSAYDEIGKAPRFLDGDDLRGLLALELPGHFGKGDPLAAGVPALLEAYLRYLEESTLVPHAFELRLALPEGLAAFERAVREGSVPRRAAPGPERPFVHRAAKTGRNDPCPCGSGKKLKNCCMKRG